MFPLVENFFAAAAVVLVSAKREAHHHAYMNSHKFTKLTRIASSYAQEFLVKSRVLIVEDI